MSIFSRLAAFAAASAIVLTSSAAMAQGFINILTGGTSGVYYPLGVALGKIYGEKIPNVKTQVQATKASVANLVLLQQGRGELAFTLGDSLKAAWNGEEEAGFKNKLDRLRTIGAIYPNYIQIVATADSGIRTLRDLKGKKIGVTQIGSTFHYNLGNFLEKEGMALGDVEMVALQALPALSDALAAKRLDAVLTAEPFVSRIESTGAGVTIMRTGDSFPWQIATVFYGDRFARDRPRAVAFMKGYVKASRHYFDAVIKVKSGPAYDEIVALTAKYTGAAPELIRKGFPYQDRDGRLMPGDVGRQLAWWHKHNVLKTPLAEKDVVDESFLREALQGMR